MMIVFGDERLPDRFWSKVSVATDGPFINEHRCWVWKASANDKGYAIFWNGQRMIGAYRHAYITLVASIGSGLEPDHLCRNRRCVNPSHLEIVTHYENVLRSRPSHCVRGHPLVEENYIRFSNGKQRCRLCKVIESRAYVERRKADLEWVKRRRGHVQRWMKKKLAVDPQYNVRRQQRWIESRKVQCLAITS